MIRIGEYTDIYIEQYVKRILTENGGQNSCVPFQSFRKRSEHCRRVMRWCLEIIEKESIASINKDELLFSAMFHDIGYNSKKIPHEEYGVKLFGDFMESHFIEPELAERIKYNIANHSRKREKIPDDISKELIILMEADMLDEEGVMGVVADCLSEGMKGDLCNGYKGAYERICQYASDILDISPMITPYAIICWEKKQDDVRHIIESLEKELFI